MASRDPGKIPTGANTSNRLVPTVPSPDETRKILIPTTSPSQPDQPRRCVDTRLSTGSGTRAVVKLESKNLRPATGDKKQHPVSTPAGRTVLVRPSSVPKRKKERRLGNGQSRASDVVIKLPSGIANLEQIHPRTLWSDKGNNFPKPLLDRFKR